MISGKIDVPNHRTLCNAGVRDYTWDDCQRNYRYAMLSVFVQLALTVNGLLGKDSAALPMAQVLGERLNALCIRHRLNEIL